MGHWSDQLIDNVAERVGTGASRDDLRQGLKRAADEIELLAGRTFGETRHGTWELDSGGLPFVDVPDLHLAVWGADAPAWPIPDPGNPAISSVLQIAEAAPAQHASALDEALWVAGHLVAAVSSAGHLSREYMLAWLRESFDSERRTQFLRKAWGDASRVNVPIAAAPWNGWWFQITRRLLWVTGSTPEERRLVEPLVAPPNSPAALVAAEPVLILARVDHQPASWAAQVRIWPLVQLPAGRPWRVLAKAVHSYGVPILTLDDASTPAEVACQLLLVAYWHGWISGDGPALAGSLATAYPKAMRRIRNGALVPDDRAAASMLLERLLRPGFDPARGTASTRRYVARLARVVVLEHLKAEGRSPRPWDQFGISERYYYKLLARFARKEAGRYDIDASTEAAIHTYLRNRTAVSDRRATALQILEARGFNHEAARKWLQRHPIKTALNAIPRQRRSTGIRPDTRISDPHAAK